MSVEDQLRYDRLSSAEVARKLAHRPLILPIGAIEQHGPHLPLSVDVDIPWAIAGELALRSSGLLAPAVIYSARSLPQSGGGPSFPGTIHVNGATYVSYMRDLLGGYLDWGATALIVVNGHYENEPFLFEALELLREEGRAGHAAVVAFSWWSLVQPAWIETHLGSLFSGWHAEHAGISETSLMLHLYPEAVRSVRIDNTSPPRAGVYTHPSDAGVIDHQGVLSRTSEASAELGRALFSHVCDEAEALLETQIRKVSPVHRV